MLRPQDGHEFPSSGQSRKNANREQGTLLHKRQLLGVVCHSTHDLCIIEPSAQEQRTDCELNGHQRPAQPQLNHVSLSERRAVVFHAAMIIEYVSLTRP